MFPNPRIVIHLTIETVDPLSGTASMESGEERRFEGWLGLLGVISELVGATGPSDLAQGE